MATSYNDYTAYGSLYQWGRLNDGHQLINWTSATTGTPVNGSTSALSSTDVPENALFITIISNPWDWRSPQNDSLSTIWGGVNGASNPCPTGFRPPTQAEWSTWATYAGISSCSSNCNTAVYNTSLKLTEAGLRPNDASLQLTGIYGLYWSSTTYYDSTYSAPSAYYLGFTSGGVSPAGNYYDSRDYGMSVRCIKN